MDTSNEAEYNRMSSGKKRRGSTNNTGRLEAFSNASPKGAADWGDCDSARLQSVVVGITALGGAVTFGLSRDQGAHSLTLMLDQERVSLWINGNADLDAELDKALATLKAMR